MLKSLTKRLENKDEGFTLIELLVVVVIIGILIAIAIPLYLNYQKGANDKSTQSDLRATIVLMEQCFADNANSYPPVADVPTAGGTMGASCSTLTIKASAGTTMSYSVNTVGGVNVSYMIQAQNSKGSKRVYCYTSAAGGPIKGLTSGTTLSTTFASSC